MTPRRLIEPARLAGAALLHTQSDERLVDLARAGNDRAFEAIVGRYRRPLLRYCRRLLPPERAEDAVQQAFLNAYRAIGAGEGELNLRPWLYRIAHNSALNLLRQNGWSYEEIDERFDGVEQPPQAVEQRERMAEVLRAVKELPERQRDAVVLRELEGRSYEEIARELGVTGGAVRQLLNRARTKLRAAATAATPPDLVAWLAARGPEEASIGERIAELTAGAGGLAAAAKLGSALLVAGAVVGGTTGAGPLPDVVGDGAGAGTQRQGVVAGGGDADDALLGDGARAVRDDFERDRAGGGRERDRAGDERDGTGEDGDDSSGPSDSSGPGPDGSDASGASDSSGSSGSGSASSGSGSDSSGSDSSGSGSDSSGPGSSGSESSGSGSSGSSSDSTGSGSSGSGSSGSGSDSSGSGSSGSGSGTSGSGTSGSGDLTADSSGPSGSGTGGSGSSGSDSSGSGSGSSGSGS